MRRLNKSRKLRIDLHPNSSSVKLSPLVKDAKDNTIDPIKKNNPNDIFFAKYGLRGSNINEDTRSPKVKRKKFSILFLILPSFDSIFLISIHAYSIVIFSG